MGKTSANKQEEILSTLKKSTIFSALTEEELKKISPLFEVLDYDNDEYIFMEDDPSNWMYVLARNRVKIVKHTKGGKDVIVEIKSPGEIFCCATVLDNRPYPESAQAMEKARAIRISRKNLLMVMDDFPFLKVGVAKYFSDRLRDANEMLKNIASEKVEKRIASILLTLSEKAGIKEGDFTKIDIPLTRQEIADMVGTTVETCIRSISKLQKNGIVKSSESKIMVKTDGLREFLGP
jgi:CRP/FNR family transcriptional regulator